MWYHRMITISFQRCRNCSTQIYKTRITRELLNVYFIKNFSQEYPQIIFKEHNFSLYFLSQFYSTALKICKIIVFQSTSVFLQEHRKFDLLFKLVSLTILITQFVIPSVTKANPSSCSYKNQSHNISNFLAAWISFCVLNVLFQSANFCLVFLRHASILLSPLLHQNLGV